MFSSNRLQALVSIFAAHKINIQAYSALLRSFITHFNDQEHYKLIQGANSIPFEAYDAKRICDAIYSALREIGVDNRGIGIVAPLIIVLLANASLDYSQAKSVESINSFNEKAIKDIFLDGAQNIKSIEQVSSIVSLMREDMYYSNFNEVLRPYSPYLILDARTPFFESIHQLDVFLDFVISKATLKGSSEVLSGQPSLTDRDTSVEAPISDRDSPIPNETRLLDNAIDNISSVDAPHQIQKHTESLFSADTQVQDEGSDVFVEADESYMSDVNAAKDWLKANNQSDYADKQLALEIGSELTLDASLKAFAIGSALLLGTVGLARLFSNADQPK